MGIRVTSRSGPVSVSIGAGKLVLLVVLLVGGVVAAVVVAVGWMIHHVGDALQVVATAVGLSVALWLFCWWLARRRPRDEV